MFNCACNTRNDTNEKIRAGDHEEGERCKCRGREKEGVMGKKEHRTGKNVRALRRKRKLSSSEERRMG